MSTKYVHHQKSTGTNNQEKVYGRCPRHPYPRLSKWLNSSVRYEYALVICLSPVTRGVNSKNSQEENHAKS